MQEEMQAQPKDLETRVAELERKVEKLEDMEWDRMKAHALELERAIDDCNFRFLLSSYGLY